MRRAPCFRENTLIADHKKSRGKLNVANGRSNLHHDCLSDVLANLKPFLTVTPPFLHSKKIDKQKGTKRAYFET